MTDVFVNLDLDSDQESIAGGMIDFIRTVFPEWVPPDGGLETRIIDGIAATAAEIADLIGVVGEEVFQAFGRTVIGIPPEVALNATVASTWTMVDNAGYTIPADTLVSISETGDITHAFKVASPVTVHPGSTATSAGGVLLTAVLPGAAPNGIAGPAVPIDALDFLADVTPIAMVGTPAGGRDAESATDYLNRLTEELRLLTPRPILPNDFAVLARRHSQVARSVAIDGWDPSDDSLDNERTVGVVIIDADGADLDTPTKDEVQAELEATREINFVVNMGEPTDNNITVVSTVRCYPGFDPAAVEAAVEDALDGMLLPSVWGSSPYERANALWRNQTVLRYLDVADVVKGARGVDFIESLTVNGGTVNVTLTGVVPLTVPTGYTITANPAS